MNEEKNIKIISLKLIIKKLIERKTLFLKVMSTIFVLSCLYILCIPRYYSTQTKLAPEIETTTNNGGLSSLASSFGIDMSKLQTADAITPILYPDLIEDNKFIVSLFTIKLISYDGNIKDSYYNYLNKYQKVPWWSNATKAISNIFIKKEEITNYQEVKNPYNLTKEQSLIAQTIKSNVTLHVDSKTGVITITTTAQDPFICKTLADSIRMKLQNFITTYRTNKARTDFEYYKKLTLKAKAEYERARQLYGSYSDANMDIVLQSFKSKEEDLENDMQLKYNNYTTLNNQMQMARAKIQERTPAFTVLQGASVPERPAGPKRMAFVFIILIISTFCFIIWILRKDIINVFA